ncbi:MAG TPA: ferredoxin reductase [Kineosporiaceae bacterium]
MASTPPRRATGLRHALRRLAEATVTPLAPDDYLDLLAPMRPGGGRARIVSVRPEGPATTLLLRPAGRWPGHRAGQYVRLRVEVDGVRCWRCYSLTGPVAPDGTIAVTVGAVPGGAVSIQLAHRTRPGCLVGLAGPYGEFTLPDELPPKVLFVTGGSGITPVMGMLRTHLDDLPDVVLVHSARSPDQVIFGPELRAWAAAGRLRLLERHTDVEGRLRPEDLPALVPDLAERGTWASGPSGLLDDLTALFETRGWGDHLRTEWFRVATGPVGEGGRIRFTRSRSVVDVDGGTSVLDAGERAGVQLPFGCRMGICFGCVVPLTDGCVRDVRNGALTRASPDDPAVVQTCIQVPAGGCTIDA